MSAPRVKRSAPSDKVAPQRKSGVRINRLHKWDLDLNEAKAVQRGLSKLVRLDSLGGEPRFIAGADVAVSPSGSLRFARGRVSADATPTRVFAAVVVWDAETRAVVETATRIGETRFPYIPGLLSFREAPTLLEAFSALSTRPDAAIFDGQGIAHPRRFGLACHVGLWLDIPSVGCAKSRLIGTHADLPQDRGAQVRLVDDGEVIGSVVRTRTNVKPVFVSPGHRIDFASATRLVLKCAARFRLPEPTRLADQLSKRAKASGPHDV
ncbi:MAG: endonuclease V [Deltaproteobacteria bacterium]|nr:endonuclease V [Deltaproteobacteria bacterium]